MTRRLVRCTRCGAPIAPKAGFCPGCGVAVSGQQNRVPTARLLSTLALAALAAALGCKRPVDKSSTVTILYDSDEYVLGLPEDDVPKFLVFLPLVTRNAQGELEGRLARSWEHSPDYHTWTIHLRSDVRWHDGVPVTAQDVKFTLELVSRADVGPWGIDPGTFSVTVLDDTTYTLTLRRGTLGSPLDDWTVYYPKHLLERLDPAKASEWGFWIHPVGNGPYRYVRHVPRTMFELEANPDYYRGKPTIERVVLKLATRESALTELLSGNVDATEYVNQTDLLKVAGDARFQVYHGSRLAMGNPLTLVWNLRHPALHDPRVRRALTLALDRRELQQALNLPTAAPIFDVMFSDRQLRRGEVPPPLPHDKAEARRLLAEAGWVEVGEDGIRRRGREPLRFVVATPLSDRAAVIIQAQLRVVGVQMDILPLDFMVMLQRQRAKPFDALLFEMPVNGWAAQRFFGPGSSIGYTNPRVALLLQRALDAVDPDDADRAYRELAPILQADLPVTFVAPSVLTTVAHRRLRGLSSPYRTSPLSHMDELWLEDGR